MKTNIKCIKKHFLTRLNKPYLNKEDKEFIILSFEVLEKYIIENKQIRIYKDKETINIKKPNKANFQLIYSEFGNPRLIKKQ
jgi:hypothetical protein